MDHLHALILGGGGGTRLWPLSRRARPKQFISFAGGETLIHACMARVEPLCGAERTWVVAGAEQAGAVREALPHLPAENLVLEPFGRNTAPAIGLGAQRILRRDADAVLAVLPADHFVSDAEGFRAAVARAARAAAEGRLVTCGIRPTHADTGFGYIEIVGEVEPGLFRAARFREKPDAGAAARFVAGGALWNSGMFFFRADRILDEIRRCLPDLAALLDRVGDRPEAGAWSGAPAISIDYGVMEKVDEFYAVPGDFGWSDVGSFAALPAGADAGEIVAIDATGNVVHAEGRLVALLGVRDLCVIVAGDAVLVCPKDRAQDVRAVVAELEKRGRKDLL